jgi:hypothetical protein
VKSSRPRLYWIRILLTPGLVALIWWRIDWIIALILTWLLVSAEISYFRTRSMYLFFFKHALTGNPHTKNQVKKNGG